MEYNAFRDAIQIFNVPSDDQIFTQLVVTAPLNQLPRRPVRRVRFEAAPYRCAAKMAAFPVK